MFKKTAKQIAAIQELNSQAKHILLRGGSRSGKTFIAVRNIFIRSLKTKSRHCILRKHFNHVKQSVWFDTFPKVIELCFPELKGRIKFDRSDWFVSIPNGSEIWIGGLDDKERTEKILGKEYSTIFFNECSEISYESRNIALTRLAEKSGLRNKCYYDCNPPRPSHWTFKEFIEKVDYNTGQPLDNPDSYRTILINPKDNQENIADDYISEILDKLPPLLRLRFRDGEFVSDETDIISPTWLMAGDMPQESDIIAKFSFVDPAVTEKSRATDSTCESAIITLGLTKNREIHDIEVIHGFYSYGTLKSICESTFKRHCNKIYFFAVEEVNAQRWLIDDLQAMGMDVFGMPADGDKVRRAISVTDLMEQGRCRIHDLALRKQLLSFPGEHLKDLVDAYVYGLRMIKKYEPPVEKPYVHPEAHLVGMESGQYWLKKYLEQQKLKQMGSEVQIFNESEVLYEDSETY